MRICLMIEGQNGVTWEQWLGLAGACERHGLEGLFRSDHYLTIPREPALGSLDAWATLAGLAARTERIRLGTLVSPATFRHPSALAKEAATVDHISGGRVELGIGAGWYEDEHRAYGFPFRTGSERMELFAEQLEIVHRQWTDETMSFAGEHYRLVDCPALPKPVQRPHPPIIVGGAAKPRTAGPAARFADEYNTVFATVEECRERRAALDRACEAVGRDPATLRFSLMSSTLVGADERDLRERVARYLADGDEGDDPDAFVRENRDRWLLGTVEDVAARLCELEAAGVERVFLQHFLHEDLEMVEVVGERLVPLV